MVHFAFGGARAAAARAAAQCLYRSSALNAVLEEQGLLARSWRKLATLPRWVPILLAAVHVDAGPDTHYPYRVPRG
jgi:hypothetical protein